MQARGVPYVPPYFSLAAAVKSDPRLLLRHAVHAESPCDQVGSAAWAAGSTLASPYCILSSLAQLLGLGRSSNGACRDASGDGSMEGGSSSSGGSVSPAALTCPALPPPAVTASMLQTPALLHSQPSWTIGAAAAELAATAGQPAAAAEDTPSPQAAAAASRALLSAHSVGPLPLSWSPRSAGSRGSSRSSSTGTTGGCAGHGSTGGGSSGAPDGGHLVQRSAGGAAAPDQPKPAEAAPAERGWSLWSLFS